MGFFDFAQIGGFPIQYAEKKTPVTEDVLEIGFIAAFIIIIIASFTILIGFKVENGLSFITRVLVSSVIGLTIMLGNFGQDWEVGYVHTKTSYKAGSPHEIDADIGIKVGLRSVNITLKAQPSQQLAGEIINYNERFEWTWDQGRFGFGPQAGLLQREFREAQKRGLPLPILWIVDYLVVDGEGLRFGRFYRTAGWYAHIAMWSALPCWIMANLLFLSIANYGAVLLILSGSFQLLACLLWASIRNSIELAIPFENGEITTKFGVSFWLTFSGGILSLTVSLAVILLDLRYPNKISVFFGYNSLYDFKLIDKPEGVELRTLSNDQEMALLSRNIHEPQNKRISIRERRTLFKFAQKDLRTERTEINPIYLDSDYIQTDSINKTKDFARRRPVPEPPTSSRHEVLRDRGKSDLPSIGAEQNLNASSYITVVPGQQKLAPKVLPKPGLEQPKILRQVPEIPAISRHVPELPTSSRPLPKPPNISESLSKTIQPPKIPAKIQTVVEENSYYLS